MKQLSFWVIAVLLIITVLVPGLIVGNWSWGSVSRSPGTHLADTGLEVAVYDNQSGMLMDLPLEEYLVGVVAAEMPASFHIEALKAQAVVARTYAVRKMRIFGGEGCPSHPRADICTDSTTNQAWISYSDMRDKWGPFSYFFYRRKIERAVEDTQGLIVTYQGEPIDALYHSTSGGKTEEASAVWGESEPYLQSVVSPYEKGAPKYATTVRLSISRMASALNVAQSELTQAVRQGGLQILQRTVSGRVATLRIGDRTWEGPKFRAALGLPSTWFNASVDGTDVVFEVRGYGHGVGMSQYGANGMAKNGTAYSGIINHYYKDIKIRPIFAE